MKMVENPYTTALQKITSGNLTLTEMIGAATRLSEAGQATLARQLYKAWIDHNREHPQRYVAYFNCAALDSEAGDLVAASESLSAAIALNADFVPAYINLGRIFEESGALDRAVELWRIAASRSAPINGNSVVYATTALTQTARVLSLAHRIEEAEEVIQQCLDINPQQHDVIEQYTALRLAQCKWPIVVSSGRLDRKALLRGINPLSMAVFTDDPLLQLASAERYVKRSSLGGSLNSESDRRHASINLNARRIRVGYVSSDLRDHAIGYLMAEFFELHNKRDIEVFAYYCGPESTSALSSRIKAAVEHWVDIRGLTDDDAAKKIAADAIDILVDVNGHTRDSRTGVFARRPAPIQVNWLGYPGSMGTPCHQYIIADDWIIPQGSEMYYSEKVVRLPCYQPNDRKRVIADEVPTRRDAGLPDDSFVYCCFNGTHKISRFTFERWLEILKGVPDSVLWLLDTSEKTKERLRDFAEQKGVLRSRIVFAPKMQNSFHLARYPLADLFLDTVPYGAHTTASDALWMGVPVLTLSGRSFASRVCGSLVRAAGLTDLVCTRPEDYVARAIALGHNRSEIETYKTALKTGRDTCLLFDTNKLVGCLEDIYRTLCADYQKGLVPQPDLTNLDTYFEVGIDHDHDGEEVLNIADYHGMYRTKLKRFHLARPLHADERLWGTKEIADAEGCKVEPNDSVLTTSELSALRSVALSLNEAGDATGALRVLEHLVAYHPSDVEALRNCAKLLNAQGRTLEALGALVALKTRISDQEVMLDDIRAVIDPTIKRFNEFVAGGNVEQATKYADALAALLPGNIAVLNSALSCNVALGRKYQAEKYAVSLAKIDPSHAAARGVLADNDNATVGRESTVDESLKASASGESTVHPLIRLRDLHDQASSILCGTLDDNNVKQVEQIVKAARGLEIDVPKDSEWAGWEKHYRLAIEAIDLTAALGPTPEPSDEPKVAFATSTGKSLNWRGVQAAAKSVGAKVVFFAAADKSYIDLYADCYVSSVLEHSDVSSMIVLHVIGGAKNLSEVAKSVGISSDQLIFAGDEFDAESIETKCYDTPPKGLSARPVAHFQSVRFLRLGSLLQNLKLPIFVSDIDLILQRGVQDLLLKFETHDIVLNENTHSTNAGSRFTANLLLANPTDNTALFLCFLRSYLEKALNGSEVSRWIDQFAIMQARHHLAARRPNTRIGYFDDSSDINNLMYTSYQEHPFRFLSLYHGFDMSSLPSSSKAPRMESARIKKTTPSRGVTPRQKRLA